jgi:hypothetical protein
MVTELAASGFLRVVNFGRFVDNYDSGPENDETSNSVCVDAPVALYYSPKPVFGSPSL